MVFENAQDRDFQYYMGEDENGVRKKQVSYKPNEKVVNCGTLTVVKEDHNNANLLWQQLLSQERVRFAAYQMQYQLRNEVLTHVEMDQRFKVRVCAPCAALGRASALRLCANSATGDEKGRPRGCF